MITQSCAGLRALLEARAEWKVCAEAATGRETVSEAARSRPDVAIVTLTMPELNGIDAARRILAVSPRTKVLLFTMHESADVLREAHEAGISGYVLKSDSEAELVDAVRRVLRGEFYSSRRLARLWPRGSCGPSSAGNILQQASPSGSGKCCSSSPRAGAPGRRPGSSG